MRRHPDNGESLRLHILPESDGVKKDWEAIGGQKASVVTRKDRAPATRCIWWTVVFGSLALIH
jgi:hypothetical protein